MTEPALDAVTVTVTAGAEHTGAASSNEDESGSSAAAESDDLSTVPLIGTAEPKLSDNPDTPVAIVMQGKYNATGLGGTIPLLVRNNSDAVVHRIDVVGTATDEVGSIVGAGASQGFNPNTIAPGEVAIGYVYFSDESAKTASDYKLEVSANDGPDPWSVDLPVDQVNHTDDSVIGSVSNPTGDTVSGPISIAAMCFDEDGAIIGNIRGYAAKDDLSAGSSSPFSIDLYGDVCPTYLIGASGYQR